jgi:hypothetical protein
MRLSQYVVAMIVAAAPLAAQQSTGPIEIGMDAMLSRQSHKTDFGSSSATFFQVPVQQIRVAVPMTPTISLEPSLGYIHASSDGSSSDVFSGELGLLVHFNENRKQPQGFVRPLIGIDDNALFGAGGTHFTAGAGLGMKVPATDRIAFRFELRYKHQFESDDVSGNLFGLAAGLSFFTR